MHQSVSGFPGGSALKNMPAIQVMQETRVPSLGWENPTSQPTPVFLPGEPHGQRSLVGYSPWGREESDTAELTRVINHYWFVHFLWQMCCHNIDSRRN